MASHRTTLCSQSSIGELRMGPTLRDTPDTARRGQSTVYSLQSPVVARSHPPRGSPEGHREGHVYQFRGILSRAR